MSKEACRCWIHLQRAGRGMICAKCKTPFNEDDVLLMVKSQLRRRWKRDKKKQKGANE